MEKFAKNLFAMILGSSQVVDKAFFPIDCLQVEKKGFPVIVFHVVRFSLNLFPY